MLEHHADADGDRSLVGPVGAVERFHQRRLAGTVLADDGVDGPGADREVDTVVGDYARETFDDVAQLDRDRIAHGGRGDGPAHDSAPSPSIGTIMGPCSTSSRSTRKGPGDRRAPFVVRSP